MTNNSTVILYRYDTLTNNNVFADSGVNYISLIRKKHDTEMFMGNSDEKLFKISGIIENDILEFGNFENGYWNKEFHYVTEVEEDYLSTIKGKSYDEVVKLAKRDKNIKKIEKKINKTLEARSTYEAFILDSKLLTKEEKMKQIDFLYSDESSFSVHLKVFHGKRDELFKIK